MLFVGMWGPPQNAASSPRGFRIPKVFVDTSAPALADSDAHNQRGCFEGKDALMGLRGGAVG